MERNKLGGLEDLNIIMNNCVSDAGHQYIIREDLKIETEIAIDEANSVLARIDMYQNAIKSAYDNSTNRDDIKDIEGIHRTLKNEIDSLNIITSIVKSGVANGGNIKQLDKKISGNRDLYIAAAVEIGHDASKAESQFYSMTRDLYVVDSFQNGGRN